MVFDTISQADDEGKRVLDERQGLARALSFERILSAACLDMDTHGEVSAPILVNARLAHWLKPSLALCFE